MTLCGQILVSRTDHDLPPPRVSIQNVSMCTFKTSPCVPAPRAHVFQCFNMCAWCRHKRGRFEWTHGGFPGKSLFERLQIKLFSRINLVIILAVIPSCLDDLWPPMSTMSTATCRKGGKRYTATPKSMTKGWAQRAQFPCLVQSLDRHDTWEGAERNALER